MDKVAAKLAKYRQAAIAHGEATAASKPRRANRAYDRLTRMRKVLTPEDIAPLLDDENVFVRKAAAVDLLKFAPEKAVSVLRAIAEGPESLHQFSAEILLEQWARGER